MQVSISIWVITVPVECLNCMLLLKKPMHITYYLSEPAFPNRIPSLRIQSSSSKSTAPYNCHYTGITKLTNTAV